MSRQQEWAESAFKNVMAVKGKQIEGADEAKYRTHALKFPSLLVQSGLVQAVTFVSSRDDTGKLFITNLASTIKRSTLIEDARTKPLSEYVRISADVLAAASWYRRFAQSELKGEAE